MKKLPYLPLWVGDYLVDTDHLSDAERGRYDLILCKLWLAPRQRLPNRDQWLSRHFRRSEERVRSELRPLIQEFCQNTSNWITHKRISDEFARALHISEVNRANRNSRKDKENGMHGRSSLIPILNKTLTHEGQVIPNALADARDAVIALAHKSKKGGSA